MSKKNKSLKALEKFFEDIDKEFDELFDFFRWDKKEKHTSEKQQWKNKANKDEYKSNYNMNGDSNKKGNYKEY